MLPSLPQPSAGVTTRSRKRMREAAVASSPAPDPRDRKKFKLQSVSPPLRRSPRHAHIPVSKPTPSVVHSTPQGRRLGEAFRTFPLRSTYRVLPFN
ncbi:hypothetical protein K439DRAFT_1634034 [Ramaria rubella]|nr:hypothetical protein K439DRAFT_1634034 [Ramaria rubella]